MPHPPAGHRRGAGSRWGGGSPHLLSCKHCLGAPELARCLAWAGQPSTSRAGCATGTVRPFAPRGGGTGLGAPRLATWESNGVSSRGSRHRRGLGGSPHLGFSGYHGLGGDSQGATRGYRGGRGSSACSALMPQGRVSGSLVQSQLSLSHRAVVGADNMTSPEPPANTALRPPLPRAIRARPAGCSLSPTTPVGLARTSNSRFLVLWTLS